MKKKSHWLVLVALIVLVTISSIIWGMVALTKLKLESQDQDKTSASEVVDDVESFIFDEVIGSEGEIVNVDSSPSLDDLISISNLESLQYHYNSICDVYDDGELVYYVSYEGTVTLGIDDINQIEYELDEANSSIHISLPDVTVLDRAVDASSLRYIFVDDSFNVPQTGTNALALCEEDLIDETSDDEIMMGMARESCMAAVDAMIRPIVEAYFPNYIIDIDYVC